MTTEVFEHISILSLNPKSQAVKDLVKKEYGLEGLKVLNSMYEQDELQSELDFLNSLEGLSNEEIYILKKQRIKQQITNLQKELE